MKFTRTKTIDKIMNMTARKKIIQGGTSAGKTFGILPLLIDDAVRSKKTITVVSRSFPHLKRGAIRDFLNIMHSLKLFDKSKWNSTTSTYTFSSGSIIEFQNADKDTARGPRRDILYINEANKGIDFETYLQYSMRTSGDIYIDFNPDNSFWAHSEVLLENDSEIITLTYEDNVDYITGESTLSPSIIDNLLDKLEKAKTSDFWRNWCDVYIYGKIGKLEGTVFTNWEILPTNDLSNYELIGYGLDFGFHPDPTAMVAVYQGEDNTLIIDELVYKQKMLTDDIYEACKDLDRSKTIWSDRDNRLIQELKLKGINIQGARKGPNSIKEGIFFIQGFELKITPRSINLIDELERYIWQDKKNDVPIDSYNHGIDSMRYAIMMTKGKYIPPKWDGINF